MEFPRGLLVTLSCRFKKTPCYSPYAINNPYQHLILTNDSLLNNQSPLLPSSLPPFFPSFHCSFCLEHSLFTSIDDDFLSNKTSTFLSSPSRHLKDTEKKGKNQKRDLI